jgi:hypothetical protein
VSAGGGHESVYRECRVCIVLAARIHILKNLRIFAPLVNGEQLELADCPTGRDLIKALLPDARSADLKALVIEATDKDGRVVRVVVSADDSETARVTIAKES